MEKNWLNKLKKSWKDVVILYLVQVFKLVNNYLDPKGLFIFDLNSEYKFKNMLGYNTFAETTEDAGECQKNFPKARRVPVQQRGERAVPRRLL